MKKKNFLIGLVFVFLQVTGWVYGAIPDSERAALIALYKSTQGDNWFNKSGWKDGQLYIDGFSMPGTEYAWKGITVTGFNVTRILLNDNNLIGNIPAELGNLSELKELFLFSEYLTQNNQLKGNIPKELGNLRHLEILNLVGNQLTGGIPPLLGNLSQLKMLDLRDNQLSGTIPPEMGNLGNLDRLKLWNNKLSGSIPVELCNLRNLKWLEISDNKLSGGIPYQLENLSNLTYLSIYGNQLSGPIPPQLGNLRNLEMLGLRNNQLSGPIPPALGNLVNLKQLILSYNQLEGPIPDEIRFLSHLEVLWLGGGNLLTGDIPDFLGSFENLNSLNLSGNLFSGEIPWALQNLSKLQFLNLSMNPNMRGDISPWLGNLTNLNYLALTNYSGSIPAELGNLNKLEFLNLNGSTLTGTIPPELGKLVNLKFLGLMCNGLTTPIPNELGNLTQLETLRLDNNRFGCPIPDWIGNLKMLKDLSLSGSYFYGTIPTWLGNLSHLQYLSLQRNQLSGSIPTELGNLGKLTYFIMYGNQLTGVIPAQIGNLSKLGTLWLCGNQLGGEIPSTFTNLKKMSDLNIGYNCLKATNTTLRAWLNAHEPDWESHQDQCSIVVTTPTVITDAVSFITKTSALFKGHVSADGGAFVTARGFCWSTGINPTTNHSKFYAGNGPGIFSTTITGLSENTTYYVRAYATNSKGTSYGENVSFTTQLTLPEKNPPFGSFDTPVDGVTVSGSIAITGWALDDSGVDSVKIYMNQGNTSTYIGNALFVEGARPDIAMAYPEYPGNTRAGWGYIMLTNFLPGGGNGTFVLSAVATDLWGKVTELGTKTIYVDNAHAAKPFGSIDTPDQGGTATGKSFINYGWALTPQPNHIPTNGSTMDVYVDGVNKGHPTYNNYRADIAALFPGYANSQGAIGYFYLDTTKYTNGVHTIQWSVTDNAGNSDGIGSRYFTIQNTSSDSAQSAAAQSMKMNLHQISTLPEDSSEPIYFSTGFHRDNECSELLPDEKGNHPLSIQELERVEIQLGQNYTAIQGFLISGHILNPLPIGSTLDVKSGTFSWSPGPGFLGRYSLVFVLTETNGQSFKKAVEIKIEPKFNSIQ